MAISSKNKGKSGGARVITYVKIVDEVIYLLSIYDKSETDTITDKELLERTQGLWLNPFRQFLNSENSGSDIGLGSIASNQQQIMHE